MQRQFCGKCGQPLSSCTCNNGSFQQFGTTGFHNSHSQVVPNSQSSAFIIKQFDNIALSQDEVVVRQYHIGAFSGLRSLLGTGNAYMIITNKRVISKSDTNYLGTSSNSVEEMNIESIAGAKTLYYKGLSIPKLVIGIIACLIGLIMLFNSFSLLDSYRTADMGTTLLISSLVCIAAGVLLIFFCRKPSYLFHLYTKSATAALTTGANLRGKILNSAGYGLVFQFKPTDEAIPMMREIGACITDIRDKGDYAIQAWQKL